jgi:transposase-like protein
MSQIQPFFLALLPFAVTLLIASAIAGKNGFEVGPVKVSPLSIAQRIGAGLVGLILFVPVCWFVFANLPAPPRDETPRPPATLPTAHSPAVAAPKTSPPSSRTAQQRPAAPIPPPHDAAKTDASLSVDPASAPPALQAAPPIQPTLVAVRFDTLRIDNAVKRDTRSCFDQRCTGSVTVYIDGQSVSRIGGAILKFEPNTLHSFKIIPWTVYEQIDFRNSCEGTFRVGETDAWLEPQATFKKVGRAENVTFFEVSDCTVIAR